MILLSTGKNMIIRRPYLISLNTLPVCFYMQLFQYIISTASHICKEDYICFFRYLFVCSFFFIHFHIVTPVSIKSGLMVENLPWDVLDIWKSPNFGNSKNKLLFLAQKPFVLVYWGIFIRHWLEKQTNKQKALLVLCGCLFTYLRCFIF